jgi:hypothetical protein
MQILPVGPEETSEFGQTKAPIVGGPSKTPLVIVRQPSWTQLPATRRRRLVAVLGTLVERMRNAGEGAHARRQDEVEADAGVELQG